jgi:hypothetical protein
MRAGALVVILPLLVSLALREQDVTAEGTQSGTASKQQPVVEEVRQLIKMLRDERLRMSEPERVVQAIERLGRMRSVEAIDDLKALLTFRRTFEWERGRPGDMYVELQLMTTDGRYPAVGALFQIGRPSLPTLVSVIQAHEPSSLETENAIFTVMLIYREEPSEGVEYLRKAATKVSSSEEAQRLLDAAEHAKRKWVH